MKVLKVLYGFFSGFFQDQKGNSSRKAAALFICLYFTNKLINKVDADDESFKYVWFGMVGIILFVLGAITSEFFDKFVK